MVLPIPLFLELCSMAYWASPFMRPLGHQIARERDPLCPSPPQIFYHSQMEKEEVNNGDSVEDGGREDWHSKGVAEGYLRWQR